MSLPTYTLQDLQQIEKEAALHLSAIYECECTVSGNRTDHPRTGSGGVDVLEAREVTATIGDEHLSVTYYADLCAAYEWERRGSYGVYLANEIRRRHERQHAGDAPDADDGREDETIVTETETEETR